MKGIDPLLKIGHTYRTKKPKGTRPRCSDGEYFVDDRRITGFRNPIRFYKGKRESQRYDAPYVEYISPKYDYPRSVSAYDFLKWVHRDVTSQYPIRGEWVPFERYLRWEE